MPKRPRRTKIIVAFLLTDALATAILAITGVRWLL
jgi:hypothetical protein